MKGGRSARNHFLLFAWACDYRTGGTVARCHSHRLPRSRWRQRTRIAENSLQNARQRHLNANPIASSKPSRYDCYDNKCEHCPVSLPPRSLAHPNFFSGTCHGDYHAISELERARPCSLCGTTVSREREGNYSAVRLSAQGESKTTRRTQGNERDNDNEPCRAKSPTMDNRLIMIPPFLFFRRHAE